MSNESYPKYRLKELRYPFKVEAGAMELKFWSGEKPYYGLVSPKNLSKARYDAVQQVYRELERGLDEEKLNGFLDCVIELAATRDIEKMPEIHFVAKTLRLRNNIANYAYLSFKMAACYYVSIDEDFNTFDWDTALVNVRHWMQHEKDLNAFFLKTHVIHILPFSGYLNKSIRDFSEVQRKVDNTELQIMLQLLGEANAKKPNGKLANAIDLLTSRQWPLESTEAPSTM